MQQVRSWPNAHIHMHDHASIRDSTNSRIMHPAYRRMTTSLLAGRRTLLTAGAVLLAAPRQAAHAADIPPPPKVGSCADCIGDHRGPLRFPCTPPFHAAAAVMAARLRCALVTWDNLPNDAGEVETTLNVCSESSTSCVSTQNDDEAHFLPPWSYDGSREAAVQQLVSVATGAAFLPVWQPS